jgi:hypothetical protein
MQPGRRLCDASDDDDNGKSAADINAAGQDESDQALDPDEETASTAFAALSRTGDNRVLAGFALRVI